MLTLAYLVMFGVSLSKEYSQISLLPVLRLQPFGFKKNATFNIHIQSSNIGRIMFFMSKYQGLSSAYTYQMKLYSLCSDSTPSLSIMNATVFSTGDHADWNGIMPEDGVFVPYLVNCDYNRTTYNISVIYQNPNSLLDTREEYFRPLCLILSITYAFLFVLWVSNGARYSMFRIPLHTIFTFMPLLQAFARAFEATLWSDRQYLMSVPPWKEQLVYILDNIYLTVSMISLSIVGSGWCIYQSNIRYQDMMHIFLSSVLFSFGSSMISKVSSLRHALCTLACAALGALWFMKITFINLIILIQLSRQMSNQKLVLAKILMAKNYVVTVIILAIVSSLLYAVTATLDFSSIHCRIIIDITYAIISCIQMGTFLFREEYGGKESGREHKKAKRPVYTPRILVEPKHSGYAILTMYNYRQDDM